jgi:hypothetical protein
MRMSAPVFSGLVAFLLTGCAGSSFESILQTSANAWVGGGSRVQVPKNLDPNLSYMRVVAGDSVAVLVLGELDSSQAGELETWYSQRAEMLRFHQGRIVSGNGLPLNWVYHPLDRHWPAWQSINAPVVYSRRVDLMPGYRFNRVDRLVVQRLAAAPSLDPTWMSMPQAHRKLLVWFEERVVAGATDTPPTWVATLPMAGSLVPVFGRQCISADFCIAWERLPARRS